MMRSLLLTATLALSASAALAAPAGLTVTQAWSRPAEAGGNGAGYLVLENAGRSARVLKAVESPLARKVEIHRSRMTGGVMRMARLDAGLVVPAGGAAALAPGGDHLMLVGLTRALKLGDTVPVTLIFADGARLTVELAVGAQAPAPAGHAHH
jgi:periplasmic copper chaperone A